MGHNHPQVITLHPDILYALSRFEARRKRLLLVRASITAASVLLAGSASTAFFDMPVPLGSTLLFSTAAIIYAGTVALFWIRAGSQLAHASSPRSTAARIEVAAPHLQGVLLSAVELSNPHPTNGDSIQLRHELQKRTAQQVVSLNPSDFLRWNLLRTDARFLMVSLLLFFTGLALDGPQFGTRCLRVLLPFASIQRPADTDIQLLQPDPRDGIVPANETINVAAEIRHRKGRSIPGAILIAESPATERFAVSMTESAPGLFSAALPVSSVPIRYQITSGDAATPSHRLDPRQRPSVKSFEKTISAPDYTGLPIRFENSQDGLVSAPEGSTVDIALKASEPIASGSLFQTIGGKEELVPSAIDSKDPHTVRARLHVNGQGSYSIQMVSRSTGFVSSNGLQWEIRSEPDAPPVVHLHEPERDLLVQLGSKLQIFGAVDDDYGLDTVTYEVQHNRGAWTAFPYAATSGKHLEVSFLWDPLLLAPRVGDAFALRIVAFDAKGQRAESRVVKVSIANATTLPEKNSALTLQKTLSGLVSEAQKQSTEALKALTEAKAAFESNSPNAPSLSLALLRAEQALSGAGGNAEAAIKTVLSQIAAASQTFDEATLETQAKALNRLLHSGISEAMQAVSKIRTPEISERIREEELDLLKRALDSATKASNLARLIQETANATTASAEAPVLATAAMAIATETLASAQSALKAAHQPSDPQDPSTNETQQELLRRQQVNQTAAAQLQRELQALAEMSQPVGQKLSSVRNGLKDAQTKAENALKSTPLADGESTTPTALTRVSTATNSLAQALDQTAKSLRSLSPALLEAEAKAVKRLNDEIQKGSDRLSKTVQDLSAIENKKKLSESTRVEQSATRLQIEADVLRADADIESLKRNAAPDAARDLQAAADAVEELSRSDIPLGDLGSKISTTSSALRTLEGVAAFNEALAAIKDASLSQTMRPEAGRVETMQASDSLSKKLQLLPQRLKRSDLPTPLPEAAQEALNALSKKDSSSLEAAAELLKKAQQHLEEPSQSARAALDALSPRLSSKMERLAQQFQESAALASERAKQSRSAERGPAKEGVTKDPDLTKQVDRLRQDLRTEANAQDTFSENGRARARDADDAAAQLKASSDALKALKNAPASKSEEAASLARTADQQGQLAMQLKQMADHFKALEGGAQETAAQSRQALREIEQRTGTRSSIEAREQRAKAVSEVATASAETLQEKLNDMAAKGASATSPQSAAAESMLKAAAAALKEGDSTRAAAAAAGAAESQRRADRVTRAEDSGTLPDGSSAPTTASGTGTGSSNGEVPGAGILPAAKQTAGQDWGRLPQTVANDLMEGRREVAPSDYRSAVDAYFKAVADRAGGKKAGP